MTTALDTYVASLSPSNWWKCQDGSGTTFSDSAGSQPFTGVTAATLGVSGGPGGATWASQSGGSSGGAQRNYWQAAALTAFSFVEWVETTDTNDYMGLMWWGSGGTNAGLLDIWCDFGSLRFEAFAANSGSSYFSSANIFDGKKHMLAMVFTPGAVACYVDGALDSTITVGATLTFTGHNSLFCTNNNLWLLNGTAGEAAEWDGVALTATQILNMWNYGNQIAATGAALGTLTGSASETLQLPATASAAGVLTAAATVGLVLPSTATASGVLTASASGSVLVPATATAAGSLIASSSGTVVVPASSSAAGTLTASASASLVLIATATASGALTASGSGVVKISTRATASGVLIAAASGTVIAPRPPTIATVTTRQVTITSSWTSSVTTVSTSTRQVTTTGVQR